MLSKLFRFGTRLFYRMRSRMVLVPYSIKVISPLEKIMQALGVSKKNFVLLLSWVQKKSNKIE